MAYTYLIDLHRYIAERLAEADALRILSPDESLEKSFQEGRIRLLQEFQEFLSVNYHSKLPRRMSKRLRKIDGSYKLV